MSTSSSAGATVKSSDAELEELQSTSDASLSSREHLYDSVLTSRSDGNQLYHEMARQLTDEVLLTSMASVKQSIGNNGVTNGGEFSWLETSVGAYPRPYVQTERLEIRNMTRRHRPVVSLNPIERDRQETISVTLAQHVGTSFHAENDSTLHSTEIGMFKVSDANRRELGVSVGTIGYVSAARMGVSDDGFAVRRDENENMLNTADGGGVRRHLETGSVERLRSESTDLLEEDYEEVAKRFTDGVLRSSVQALESSVTTSNGFLETRSDVWLEASGASTHSRVYVQTDRLNSRITSSTNHRVNDRRVTSLIVGPKKRVTIQVRPEDIAFQSTLRIDRDPPVQQGKTSPKDSTKEIPGLSTSSIQESDACGVLDNEGGSVSDRSERTAWTPSQLMASPDKDIANLDFREDHFADNELLKQAETREKAAPLEAVRTQSMESSLVFKTDASRAPEILRDSEQQPPSTQTTEANMKFTLVPQFDGRDSKETSRQQDTEAQSQSPTQLATKSPKVAGYEILRNANLEAFEDSGNEDDLFDADQRKVELVSLKVTSMDDKENIYGLPRSRQEVPFDDYKDGGTWPSRSLDSDHRKTSGDKTYRTHTEDDQFPEEKRDDFDGTWLESDEEEGYNDDSEELLVARKEDRVAIRTEIGERKVQEVVVDIRNNRREDGTDRATELAEEFADGAEAIVIGSEYSRDALQGKMGATEKATHVETKIVEGLEGKVDQETEFDSKTNEDVKTVFELPIVFQNSPSVPASEHRTNEDSENSHAELSVLQEAPVDADDESAETGQSADEGSRISIQLPVFYPSKDAEAEEKEKTLQESSEEEEGAGDTDERQVRLLSLKTTSLEDGDQEIARSATAESEPKDTFQISDTEDEISEMNGRNVRLLSLKMTSDNEAGQDISLPAAADAAIEEDAFHDSDKEGETSEPSVRLLSYKMNSLEEDVSQEVSVSTASATERDDAFHSSFEDDKMSATTDRSVRLLSLKVTSLDDEHQDVVIPTAPSEEEFIKEPNASAHIGEPRISLEPYLIGTDESFPVDSDSGKRQDVLRDPVQEFQESQFQEFHKTTPQEILDEGSLRYGSASSGFLPSAESRFQLPKGEDEMEEDSEEADEMKEVSKSKVRLVSIDFTSIEDEDKILARPNLSEDSIRQIQNDEISEEHASSSIDSFTMQSEGTDSFETNIQSRETDDFTSDIGMYKFPSDRRKELAGIVGRNTSTGSDDNEDSIEDQDERRKESHNKEVESTSWEKLETTVSHEVPESAENESEEIQLSKGERSSIQLPVFYRSKETEVKESESSEEDEENDKDERKVRLLSLKMTSLEDVDRAPVCDDDEAKNETKISDTEDEANVRSVRLLSWKMTSLEDVDQDITVTGPSQEVLSKLGTSTHITEADISREAPVERSTETSRIQETDILESDVQYKETKDSTYSTDLGMYKFPSDRRKELAGIVGRKPSTSSDEDFIEAQDVKNESQDKAEELSPWEKLEFTVSPEARGGAGDESVEINQSTVERSSVPFSVFDPDKEAKEEESSDEEDEGKVTLLSLKMTSPEDMDKKISKPTVVDDDAKYRSQISETEDEVPETNDRSVRLLSLKVTSLEDEDQDITVTKRTEDVSNEFPTTVQNEDIRQGRAGSTSETSHDHETSRADNVVLPIEKDDSNYSTDLGMYKFPSDRRKELAGIVGRKTSTSSDDSEDSVVDRDVKKESHDKEAESTSWEKLETTVSHEVPERAGDESEEIQLSKDERSSIQLPVFYRSKETEVKEENSTEEDEENDKDEGKVRLLSLKMTSLEDVDKDISTTAVCDDDEIKDRSQISFEEEEDVESNDRSVRLLSLKMTSLEDEDQDIAVTVPFQAPVSELGTSTHLTEADILREAPVERPMDAVQTQESDFLEFNVRPEETEDSTYSRDLGMYKFPSDRRGELAGIIERKASTSSNEDESNIETGYIKDEYRDKGAEELSPREQLEITVSHEALESAEDESNDRKLLRDERSSIQLPVFYPLKKTEEKESESSEEGEVDDKDDRDRLLSLKMTSLEDVDKEITVTGPSQAAVLSELADVKDEESSEEDKVNDADEKGIWLLSLKMTSPEDADQEITLPEAVDVSSDSTKSKVDQTESESLIGTDAEEVPKQNNVQLAEVPIVQVTFASDEENSSEDLSDEDDEPPKVDETLVQTDKAPEDSSNISVGSEEQVTTEITSWGEEENKDWEIFERESQTAELKTREEQQRNERDSLLEAEEIGDWTLLDKDYVTEGLTVSDLLQDETTIKPAEEEEHWQISDQDKNLPFKDEKQQFIEEEKLSFEEEKPPEAYFAEERPDWMSESFDKQVNEEEDLIEKLDSDENPIWQLADQRRHLSHQESVEANLTLGEDEIDENEPVWKPFDRGEEESSESGGEASIEWDLSETDIKSLDTPNLLDKEETTNDPLAGAYLTTSLDETTEVDRTEKETTPSEEPLSKSPSRESEAVVESSNVYGNYSVSGLASDQEDQRQRPENDSANDQLNPRQTAEPLVEKLDDHKEQLERGDATDVKEIDRKASDTEGEQAVNSEEREFQMKHRKNLIWSPALMDENEEEPEEEGEPKPKVKSPSINIYYQAPTEAKPASATALDSPKADEEDNYFLKVDDELLEKFSPAYSDDEDERREWPKLRRRNQREIPEDGDTDRKLTEQRLEEERTDDVTDQDLESGAILRTSANDPTIDTYKDEASTQLERDVELESTRKQEQSTENKAFMIGVTSKRKAEEFEEDYLFGSPPRKMLDLQEKDLQEDNSLDKDSTRRDMKHQDEVMTYGETSIEFHRPQEQDSAFSTAKEEQPKEQEHVPKTDSLEDRVAVWESPYMAQISDQTISIGERKPKSDTAEWEKIDSTISQEYSEASVQSPDRTRLQDERRSGIELPVLFPLKYSQEIEAKADEPTREAEKTHKTPEFSRDDSEKLQTTEEADILFKLESYPSDQNFASGNPPEKLSKTDAEDLELRVKTSEIDPDLAEAGNTSKKEFYDFQFKLKSSEFDQPGLDKNTDTQYEKLQTTKNHDLELNSETTGIQSTYSEESITADIPSEKLPKTEFYDFQYEIKGSEFETELNKGDLTREVADFEVQSKAPEIQTQSSEEDISIHSSSDKLPKTEPYDFQFKIKGSEFRTEFDKDDLTAEVKEFELQSKTLEIQSESSEEDITTKGSSDKLQKTESYDFQFKIKSSEFETKFDKNDLTAEIKEFELQSKTPEIQSQFSEEGITTESSSDKLPKTEFYDFQYEIKGSEFETELDKDDLTREVADFEVQSKAPEIQAQSSEEGISIDSSSDKLPKTEPYDFQFKIKGSEFQADLDKDDLTEEAKDLELQSKTLEIQSESSEEDITTEGSSDKLQKTESYDFQFKIKGSEFQEELDKDDLTAEAKDFEFQSKTLEIQSASSEEDITTEDSSDKLQKTESSDFQFKIKGSEFQEELDKDDFTAEAKDFEFQSKTLEIQLESDEKSMTTCIPSEALPKAEFYDRQFEMKCSELDQGFGKDASTIDIRSDKRPSTEFEDFQSKVRTSVIESEFGQDDVGFEDVSSEIQSELTDERLTTGIASEKLPASQFEDIGFKVKTFEILPENDLKADIASYKLPMTEVADAELHDKTPEYISEFAVDNLNAGITSDLSAVGKDFDVISNSSEFENAFGEDNLTVSISSKLQATESEDIELKDKSSEFLHEFGEDDTKGGIVSEQLPSWEIGDLTLRTRMPQLEPQLRDDLQTDITPEESVSEDTQFKVNASEGQPALSEDNLKADIASQIMPEKQMEGLELKIETPENIYEFGDDDIKTTIKSDKIPASESVKVSEIRPEVNDNDLTVGIDSQKLTTAEFGDFGFEIETSEVESGFSRADLKSDIASEALPTTEFGDVGFKLKISEFEPEFIEDDLKAGITSEKLPTMEVEDFESKAKTSKIEPEFTNDNFKADVTLESLPTRALEDSEVTVTVPEIRPEFNDNDLTVGIESQKLTSAEFGDFGFDIETLEVDPGFVKDDLKSDIASERLPTTEYGDFGFNIKISEFEPEFGEDDLKAGITSAELPTEIRPELNDNDLTVGIESQKLTTAEFGDFGFDVETSEVKPGFVGDDLKTGTISEKLPTADNEDLGFIVKTSEIQPRFGEHNLTTDEVRAIEVGDFEFNLKHSDNEPEFGSEDFTTAMPSEYLLTPQVRDVALKGEIEGSGREFDNELLTTDIPSENLSRTENHDPAFKFNVSEKMPELAEDDFETSSTTAGVIEMDRAVLVDEKGTKSQIEFPSMVKFGILDDDRKQESELLSRWEKSEVTASHEAPFEAGADSFAAAKTQDEHISIQLPVMFPSKEAGRKVADIDESAKDSEVAPIFEKQEFFEGQLSNYPISGKLPATEVQDFALNVKRPDDTHEFVKDDLAAGVPLAQVSTSEDHAFAVEGNIVEQMPVTSSEDISVRFLDEMAKETANDRTVLDTKATSDLRDNVPTVETRDSELGLSGENELMLDDQRFESSRNISIPVEELSRVTEQVYRSEDGLHGIRPSDVSFEIEAESRKSGKDPESGWSDFVSGNQARSVDTGILSSDPSISQSSVDDDSAKNYADTNSTVIFPIEERRPAPLDVVKLESETAAEAKQIGKNPESGWSDFVSGNEARSVDTGTLSPELSFSHSADDDNPVTDYSELSSTNEYPVEARRPYSTDLNFRSEFDRSGVAGPTEGSVLSAEKEHPDMMASEKSLDFTLDAAAAPSSTDQKLLETSVGTPTMEAANEEGIEMAEDALTSHHLRQSQPVVVLPLGMNLKPEAIPMDDLSKEPTEEDIMKDFSSIPTATATAAADEPATLHPTLQPPFHQTAPVQPQEGAVPTQEHTACRDDAVSLIALATGEIGPNELEKRKQKENQLFQEGSRRRPPATPRSSEAAALSAKALSIKASSEILQKDSRPVGAVGFVAVNNDVNIPPNDFFTPGRVFEARIQHSSYPASSDDRRVNFKTLSIKLSDHDTESPFDLVLHTGQISPFCSAETMDQFQAALRTGKTQNIRQAILTTPACVEAALDGLRNLPDSYYHQHYYSPVIYNFRSTDGGRKYLVRFRVIPKDGSQETGRLLPEQRADIWTFLSQDYVPQTTKPACYLRDEYKGRFQGTGSAAAGRTPQYDIQIQLHEVSAGDADKTNKWYNPFLIWNEPYHPWFSLATLTAADLLPGRSNKATQFTVARLPSRTLSFPPASSIQDFNGVPEMLAIAATSDQRPDALAKTAAETGISAKQAEYYIYCVTGDRMSSGTLSDIYVSIVGTTGRTAYQKLEPRYKTDFERAGKATFVILDRPVGYLRYIKLFKEKHTAPSDWYLDYLILSTPYNNKSYTLPVYRWLTDEVSLLTVRDGPGVLHSFESREDMRVQRTLEVSFRQLQLKWRVIHGQNPYSMLPGYLQHGELLSAIPGDLQSDAVGPLEVQWREHRAGKFSLFKTIMKFFTSRKATISVEFEKTLADTIADKYENSKVMVHILRNWREDTEFARQLINGCSPFRIQRLDTIPPNFRVTNEMVADRLGPGATLEGEMQDGRIFLVSFPDLFEPAIICLADADVGRGQQRRSKGKLPPKFICAPKVLLYSTRGDQPAIVPLAIQLNEAQSPPGGEPLIFTKRDDVGTYSDWMVAKMWVRVAATNAQIIGSNLSTRLMMETVALALLRNLPAVHPVHKLLIQHLKDIVAINAVYRQHVLPVDGALAEVLAMTKGVHLQYIAKLIAEMDFSSFDGERTFRRLKLLTDDDILPGYWLRDDLLRHWSAIKDFVSEIIGVYYKSDSDVSSDPELRNFTEDLRLEGGLPSVTSPETVDELIQFVTAVIYTCTSHEAATSRGFLDTFAYCPNSPPCMMRPPPTARHPKGYTEQEMKDMLPNPDHVERFIGFVMLLFGGYKPAQVPLGSYPERYFSEAPCLIAIDNFRRRLRQVAEDIRLRNANIDCPFEYLLPNKVHQFFTV